MKKLKSYTSIWTVEKIIYAIGDLNLPFSVTMNQIMWFVGGWLVMLLFGDVPPFSMVEGDILKYFAFPAALAWFMTQRSLDGKKPLGFLKSLCLYALRPKLTYAGKAVTLKRYKVDEEITAVRSVVYVPD